MEVETIFCFIDDFCKEFVPFYKGKLLPKRRRTRQSIMSLSEVLTILIMFHQSHYRDFKSFYLFYICKHMKKEFPNTVSYNRFVELQKSVLLPLCYLSQMFKGEKTGIYFVDSTPIEVCHIKRANRNKTFKNLALKSKSTMGYFYGFKLHLVINDKGEIMAFKLTDSKTDDRVCVDDLTQGLTGKIVGDKGYIKKALSESLFKRGLKLITRLRKNMKAKLMLLHDKLLLRKRGIIETVNDQLKNISQIEHTRHRSKYNFLVNILCGIIAYGFQPKKPKLNFSKNDQISLESMD